MSWPLNLMLSFRVPLSDESRKTVRAASVTRGRRQGDLEMWEWREDGRRGGWRLDADSIKAQDARDEWADEPTPIFRAMASAWEDRQRHAVGGRNAVDTARHDDQRAGAPEPRSGSRPLPAQLSNDIGRPRALASTDTMPPPPPRAWTPDDELEHRAKHRRGPQAARSSTGGRHALQLREEDTGRHACKVVKLVPRT